MGKKCPIFNVPRKLLLVKEKEKAQKRNRRKYSHFWEDLIFVLTSNIVCAIIRLECFVFIENCYFTPIIVNTKLSWRKYGIFNINVFFLWVYLFLTIINRMFSSISGDEKHWMYQEEQINITKMNDTSL